MRSRSSSPCVAGVFVALLGCRPAEPATSSVAPDQPTTDQTTDPATEQVTPRNPEEFGPPPRWEIDGTTIAVDPSLPLELDRALREHGRLREDVQDHIVVDINDDGRLDAVVSLPAPAIAGAYDFLVLLTDGDSVRVYTVEQLVKEAPFTVAVVPLVDGPTLIAASPRLGACERGPGWTFLRPTGGLLEIAGALVIAPYDCKKAKIAEIVFVRGEDGRVSTVELRHDDTLMRYQWDTAKDSLAQVPDSP